MWSNCDNEVPDYRHALIPSRRPNNLSKIGEFSLLELGQQHTLARAEAGDQERSPLETLATPFAYP